LLPQKTFLYLTYKKGKSRREGAGGEQRGKGMEV